MTWQPRRYQQQRITWCLRRNDGRWWSKRYGWSTNPLLRREFDTFDQMPTTLDGRPREVNCGLATYFDGGGENYSVYAQAEQARGKRE